MARRTIDQLVQLPRLSIELRIPRLTVNLSFHVCHTCSGHSRESSGGKEMNRSDRPENVGKRAITQPPSSANCAHPHKTRYPRNQVSLTCWQFIRVRARIQTSPCQSTSNDGEVSAANIQKLSFNRKKGDKDCHIAVIARVGSLSEYV